MAKQHDKIIVLDLEATCWEGYPPEGQKSDIIEIGFCLLDLRTLERTDKNSIIIKPTRSKVSEFCVGLTTLTQDMVDTGTTFENAMNTLREYGAKRKRAWASWGDYDRRQIEKQCRDMRIDYPFGVTHLNVKSLFTVLMGMNKEVGLGEAVKRVTYKEFDGTQHRGVDDAWNIAMVLSKLLGRFREGGISL